MLKNTSKQKAEDPECMGVFTMLQTMYKLGIPSRNKRVPRSTIAAEDVLSLVSPTPWKCAATLYKFSVTENILQK